MKKRNVEEFYDKKGGENLIEEKLLISEIKKYLEKEKETIKKILYGEKYSGMIEIGCMNGRNLEIANELKIKYLGIDIVERFVKEANKKIDTLNLDAIAIKCDAKCLNKIKNHFSKHFLAIFPFNSFGNIQNPQKVLNSTYKNKLDTLILTYKTDIKTTKIRKKYLENTLFEKIKKRSSKKGVLFTSNKGLSSYAYSAEEIIKIGKAAGYKKIKEINFSKIGKGYLLLKE